MYRCQVCSAPVNQGYTHSCLMAGRSSSQWQTGQQNIQTSSQYSAGLSSNTWSMNQTFPHEAGPSSSPWGTQSAQWSQPIPPMDHPQPPRTSGAFQTALSLPVTSVPEGRDPTPTVPGPFSSSEVASTPQAASLLDERKSSLAGEQPHDQSGLLNAGKLIYSFTPSIETEPHKEYRAVPPHQSKWFWRIGRVFKTLWSEPARPDDNNNDSRLSTVWLGERCYTEVIRFVVLANFEHHVLCS